MLIDNYKYLKSKMNCISMSMDESNRRLGILLDCINEVVIQIHEDYKEEDMSADLISKLNDLDNARFN